MHSARTWLLASLTLVAACAGGSQKPVGTSLDDRPDAAPAASAEPVLVQPDAGAPGPGASQGEDAGPVPIDPDAVRAVVNKTGEAASDAPLGLRFEVAALGPDEPWIMALVNRGTEAAQISFDPRLLAFDVELPEKPDAKAKKPKGGKPPKPRECRLPAEVVPATIEDSARVKLEPGEGLVQNFDPRLYCSPNAKEPLLVPGAKLTPRFGWPVKVKLVYKQGKRVESTENQQPPFVAEPAEAEGSLPSHADSADAGAEAPPPKPVATPAKAAKAGKAKAEEPPEPDRRVKELRGTSIELGSEFARKPSEPSDSPLSLGIRGSDAADEEASTVSVTLRNRSKSRLDVYFRRELVSFEVAGPDGVSTCDPEPDSRSPDRQAFTTLRPGGEISAVSRLMEMCPAHTFARPGLYRVSARFDSTNDGAKFGLHAFTGRVVASDAALVRIRRGPLPFQGTGPVQHVRVGSQKY